MLFLVTNRQKKGSTYGDEEKPNGAFDYLYDYNYAPRLNDKFQQSGKNGFRIALLRELKRIKAQQKCTPKVVIYIHGYNNDFQESIDEAFDFEKHITPIIGYQPVVVGFSWPSSGKTHLYISDREEARDSVKAFTRFLLELNKFIAENERDCFSTTICVAHSMGNYVLRKGLEYLSDVLGTPTGRMMFDETIMLAPDLSSKDIELDGKGRFITDFSRRVHVYYSKYDRALKASSAKRFGRKRLGRHGVYDYSNIHDKIIVVDAKQYAEKGSVKGIMDRAGEQVSVHSSHRYHPNILADIEMVMSSVDRDLIPNRDQVPDSDGILRENHYRLK